jgi:hypothetical protein
LKHQLATSVLIAALTFSFVVSANAERPKLTKPSERSFEIRHTRFMFVPKLTTGFLIGKVADQLRDLNDASGELLLFGAGFSVEGYPWRRLGVGFSAEVVWRIGNLSKLSPAKLTSFSGYGLYRFAPQSRSSLFTKIEAGTVSGSYRRGRGNRSLGTYMFLRLGVGHYFYTSPTNNARFEFYYKHAFSGGHTLPISAAEIGYDAAFIGIETGFGFGL